MRSAATGLTRLARRAGSSREDPHVLDTLTGKTATLDNFQRVLLV